MRPGSKPPSSAIDPRVREAPGRARHRGRGRAAVLAHVQLRLRIVEAGHRMRDVVAVGQRQHVHARVRPELAAHAARRRRAPAAPSAPSGRRGAARRAASRSTPPCSRGASGSRCRSPPRTSDRSSARRAVEHAERDLAPAVRHVEEQPAARPPSSGPQQVEVGGELDEPARVARRQPQVRDRLVLPGRRVRGEVQHARRSSRSRRRPAPARAG